MAFTTIVSPEELHAHLRDPGFVVLDCRHSLADFSLGRRLYDESHVPGAFFASVEDDLAGAKTGTNGRHPLPDPETLARFLRGIGADDDTQLVAYDAGADMFAARFWFLSRWIGHDAVAILDGGFAAWSARGYPVTAAPSEPAREGSLSVRLRPELVVDAAFVLSHLGGAEMQLLDARAIERFTGESEPIDPVGGHIPGALQRWFKDNFSAEGTLKSREQLREEFARAQLDPKRTVHQCGSGVSSAVTQLAMAHAGLEGSRIYNGSWSEWVADPSRPIAKGP
ncbi:MAG: sulfurtransferase [Candidatus Eremiobacteraeota bacterium]|nr:sulfurtransferase [Candidatus Eremiobacteraeota bacterium]MBV8498770.1 sulfurtransferase [Candidatus Eremiobacteraeota bacterium]